MAKVLQDYFRRVQASDLHDYGYGSVQDFLTYPCLANSYDWVIANPPFMLAEKFVHRSLLLARQGVAILARTAFLEGVGRYRDIFQTHPPSVFAQFTERVPMVKGRLDKKVSTATAYGWFIWDKADLTASRLTWIPACRKLLERDGDYDLPAW